MKKFLSFLLILFAGISVLFAQPQKMTYQAVVRDANNELVVNQLVGIQVSIYEDFVNGPLVYCETHTATTNANALVTIEIGTGVRVYVTSLADVQWGKHDHFLKVEIDPAGGTNYSITGTQQLMSVPYAFYAESAKLVDTAKYAANALHADTAYYLANFQNSDTSLFSYNSDTAAFANNAQYADSAAFANAANSAVVANSANYADSTRISNYANYADIADYNKLLNKPTGTNMGDILYWDTVTTTWQILPAGNIGEVLTMDSNYIPQWNTGGGASYNLPTVVTNPVNSYTGYDANVSGAVTNDGGTPFVVGGFCWSQNANPTINDNYSMDGIGVTNFNHTITGLNLGTTYHFRAFATNSAGTAYGADESFTTWNYPTVTTNSTVTTISATTAYCGGNVTSDGGNYVNQRGVVWSSWNSTPDINNNDGMTSNGGGTGTFQSYMTGLQQGVTYYVCAYATNSIGTVYGSTVSFTTLRTPIVSTNNTTDIDTMSAVSGGNVSSDGGDPVTDYGIVWSTYSWVDINNYLGITSHGAGTPPFTFYDTMKNLTPGQTYYVKAYATNSIGTNYGSYQSFSALPVKPTVTTDPISWYDVYYADCSGNVTADGGAWVSQRGFCWNTTGNPTIADSYTTDWNGGTGYFYGSMSGLNPGTKYYVRAFATNSAGTAYGNEVTFTTYATTPTVTTDQVSDITATTAVSGGNVTSDGGDSVTVRGIVWRLNNTPTISNYTGKTTNGSGLGTFIDTMTSLSPGQTYYVRAYATNSMGTSYGSNYSFQAKTTVPTVATSATATNITGTSAQCGGSLTDKGGVNATIQCGICWDTVQTPTLGVNNYTVTNVNSYTNVPYQFSGNITGLTDSTTYWVCAYATNSNGTSYGTAISFTTLVLPKVTTDSVTNITQTSAASGVNVLSDGGNAVSSCGVCWDTLPNPTISNSHSSDGAGMGSFYFSSLISNLNDSTTYYVRAYATSSAGTGYGQVYSFTTLGFQACTSTPTVTDYDGNVYKTIQIGNQCWMRENLRTTHYHDGTQITKGVITSTSIPLYYTPGYSWNPAPAVYGYLYNWASVMNGASQSNNVPSGIQGVCPTGWHVPSYNEWQLFYNYMISKSAWLCNNSYMGRAMASQTGWGTCGNGCYVGNYNPSSSSNMSGFSAYPAGYYYYNSDYAEGMGDCAYFWTTTESGSNDAQGLNLCSCSEDLYLWSSYGKYYGMSVRCIQDYTIADGNPCPGTPTVSDNDGNTYNTVEIGGQCWMKENLRTTKYPDGTSIGYGQGMSTSSTTGYYYHANNNSSNDATYGLLYNWPAAMNGANTEKAQGICPSGWHIPSNSDFNSLKNYVSYIYGCNGNSSYMAKALASTTNWNSNSSTCAIGNDLTANNATGFTLQPAGYRQTSYSNFCSGTILLSSTPYNGDQTYALETNYSANFVYVSSCYWWCHYKFWGHSVRCIKD